MTKLDKLAHEIAAEACETTIDCQCLAVRLRGADWFDTRNTAPGARRYVKRSMKYLEACGLLIRHKTRPDLVRWEA